MTLLSIALKRHKKVWISKQLSNFKSPTYYKFDNIKDGCMMFDRFYPNSGNWLRAELLGHEAMKPMKIVRSKEIISMLEAEHAKYLLIN